MSLTVNQQKLLNEICKQPGGTDIHEAMAATGFNYETVENTLFQLRYKGYDIVTLGAGGHYDPTSRFSGWIKRMYLSPYDPKHETLVKNKGGNQHV